MQIDEFLNKHDRGLIVLRGVAGVGKSAFLAHLVKQRSYFHTFISLTPGTAGIPTAILNLATQLIRSWELESYTNKGFLPRSAIRADFLQNVIFQAATRRDEVKPDEKIVIVIDGLDEAGTLVGQNVMGIPSALPKGVYLIVSQRPVPLALNIDAPRIILDLDVESKENQADIRVYIDEMLKRPGFSSLLVDTGLTSSQFAETLYSKSHGLWIYLHCIERQIESSQSLNLVDLPDGIIQYYARFWSTLRAQNREHWYSVLLPLLAALAAAKEAILVSSLLNWSGIQLPAPQVHRILEETWSPFIAFETKNNEKYYRFYHATVVEFLSGQTRSELLNDSERILIQETSVAVKTAHGQIADYFLNSWGGWGTTLDGLKDSSLREQTNRYGLHYLTTHLMGCERFEVLHQLLQLKREHVFEVTVSPKRRLSNLWLRKNNVRTYSSFESVWYAAHKDSNELPGYVTDIDIASKWAEQLYSESHDAKYISRQIQYVLIQATLNSHINNTVPELLPWLLEHHLWNKEQAAAYTRIIQSPKKRAQALVEIIDELTTDDTEFVLSTAQELSKEVRKSTGFKNTRLIPLFEKVLQHLIGVGCFKEAIQLVEDQELDVQIEVYSRLAEISPEAQAMGLKQANALEKSLDRLQALLLFLPSMDVETRLLLSTEILRLAQSMHFDDQQHHEIWKSPVITDKALHAFTPHLSRSSALMLLRIYQQSFPNVGDKIHVLSCLAPYLPPKSRQDFIEEIIQDNTLLLSFSLFQSELGAYWQREFEELTDKVAQLLDFLTTEKRTKLTNLILDHAEGPTKWRWWKHLLQRTINGHFRAEEDLIPLAPLGLELLSGLINLFNRGADDQNLVIKQFWLISLYKYYQSSPDRFSQYQQILTQALSRAKPSQRIFLLTKLISMLEVNKRDWVFSLIMEALLQLPADRRKDHIPYIVPWINKEIQSSQDRRSIEILLSVSEYINDSDEQLWLYSGLVPYASHSLRSSILPAVVFSIPGLSDRLRTWALVSVTPYLDDYLFQQALKIAKEEKSRDTFWTDRLYFPGNSLADIISVVQDEKRRTLILKQVNSRFFYSEKPLFFADAAEYVPETMLEEVLAEAQKHLDTLDKALSIGALVTRFPRDRQKMLLTEVENTLLEVESTIRAQRQELRSQQQSDQYSSFSEYSLEERQEMADRIRERIAQRLENTGLIDDAINILLTGNMPEHQWGSKDTNPKIRRLSLIIPKLSKAQLEPFVNEGADYLIKFPVLLVSVFSRYMAIGDFVSAYGVLLFIGAWKMKKPSSNWNSVPLLLEDLASEDPKEKLWVKCLDQLLVTSSSSVSIDAALDDFCRELPAELMLDIVEHVSKKARPYFQVKFAVSIMSRIPNNIRASFLRWTVQVVEEIYADDGTALSPRSLGDDVLVALCKGLGEAGDIREALQIAQSIRSQNRRDAAFLEVLLTFFLTLDLPIPHEWALAKFQFLSHLTYGTQHLKAKF